MLDGGDRACAMEVSSHALELGRADAIAFAAALFTNLTQDHLDFHPTMEDYFQAKRRLFLPEHGAAPPRRERRQRRRPLRPPPGRGARRARVTFAVDSATADYRPPSVRCGFDGCRFKLHTPGGRARARAADAGALQRRQRAGRARRRARARRADSTRSSTALERGVRVPGRFEPVDEGQDFAVLVDYAHTPDSLENVLRAARELVAAARGAGRVLCVFGAGGDRDRGKRPLMGEIAARLADVAIVTSDNPRSEDPERSSRRSWPGSRERAPRRPGARTARGRRAPAIARGDRRGDRGARRATSS